MKELDVAVLASEAGAKVIRRYYEKKFKVRLKGKTDLVTEVDEKAQAAICKVIHKYFPNDAILAEESGLSQTKSAVRRWIIDPIDGTTNFAHGYPIFCVSIAFEANGEIICGVINDPTRRDLFHAVKGRGSFLNGKRIHVSSTEKLSSSLLVTGFPYDLNDPRFNNVPYFLHFIRRTHAVRRDGSAALNLAYVAAGRFDGFWELSLSLWDYAAGLLLVQEAGGIIKHISGRDLKLGEPAIVASNPRLYPEFRKHLKKMYGKN